MTDRGDDPTRGVPQGQEDTEPPTRIGSRGRDRRFGRFDHLARGLVRIGAEGVLVPTVIGMLVGVAVWGLVHDGVPPGALSRLKRSTVRADAMAAAWWGVLALWCVHLIAQLGVRIRSGEWRLVSVNRLVNKCTLPLAVGPLLIALRTRGIESKRPIFTYGLILTAAAMVVPVCGSLVSALRAAGRRALVFTRHRRAVAWALGLLAVLAVWLVYGAWFSQFAIHHHRSFRTHAFDLGIYDNLFFRSSHGDWLGCSLVKGEYHGTAHFDPIIILLSPIHRLWPRAETILILQSYWIGACVIPLYLLTWHRCKSAVVGVGLACCAALYPAMQGANMYEFHSLSLLGMPLMWLLFFLARGAVWRYFAALLVCLLVREDAALLLCFVGGASLFSCRGVHVRLGIVTILVSMAYFVMVKTLFMSSSEMVMSGDDAYSFAYYYRHLIPKDTGIPGLLTSLISNPGHALGIAFKEAKALYLLGLLVPLLFVPLFGGTWRIALLYGAAFLLLASRRPVFSLYFQYSTVIYPILFALIPEGLLRLRARRGLVIAGARGDALMGGLVGAMMLASVLCCWKFGGVWDNKNFRAGFQEVSHRYGSGKARRYARFEQVIARIPPGAVVTASKRLAPHVSSREGIYLARHKKVSDYLLIEIDKLGTGGRRRHDRRVRRGDLLEIGRSRGIILYQVIEQSRAVKAAQKNATRPTSRRVKRKATSPRGVSDAPDGAATSRPVTPVNAPGAAIIPKGSVKRIPTAGTEPRRR